MDTPLHSHTSFLPSPAAGVPFISPQQLASRIGRVDVPFLLDVRGEHKFLESPRRLAGALRCPPESLAAFAASQDPREVVAYCAYGHNVSIDAVVQLRAAGWNASALSGGIEGGEDSVDSAADISSWRAQALPSVRKKAEWGVTGEKPSRWITRERPKIDRIACPWLVRRFIDPLAEFFYVPTLRVLDEAQRLNAVAYDIPGGQITHDGELCSFDTLIRAFDLSAEGLERLTCVVRGADTDRLDIAPQSAGLLALSLGLSQLHADDDHAMLEAAMPLYDALYAWCRSAQDEPHNWKPETMGEAQ